MTTISIFPTPLYITSVDLTEKDLEFFNRKHSYVNNEGNFRTENTYILNSVELISLKEKLQNHLENYFDEIIQADNEVKPYITQSWINFTKENGHHHLHAHANSIVTAVLYIETTEGDCIKFHASDYRAHYFKPKKVNNFNASEFTVKVQKGNLILFPANLIHSVPEKKNKGNRLSLSFNSFFKGTAGDLHDLTKLDI